MPKIKLSRNANSRNKRKVINGFIGNGTSSDWVKTTDFGSYKSKPTTNEIAYKKHIKQTKLNISRREIGNLAKQLLTAIR